MSTDLLSMASWLQIIGGEFYCLRCEAFLWECPSCGDYQCRCPLIWISQVKVKDRRLMSNQHYNRLFVAYTRNPFGEGEHNDN